MDLVLDLSCCKDDLESVMLTGFTLTFTVSAAEACDANLSYIQHGISHQAALVVGVMDTPIFRVLPSNRPIMEKEKKRKYYAFRHLCKKIKKSADQGPIVSACRQFDVALLDRRRGRGAHPVEQDPWLTESGMAEAHHALQHAQEEERHLLTGSHQQLQDLETRRVDLIKKIVTAFLTSYRCITVSPTTGNFWLDDCTSQQRSGHDINMSVCRICSLYW